MWWGEKLLLLLPFFLFLFFSSSSAAPESDICAFDNIYGAGSPPYYVNYKLQPGEEIKIDGSIDDPAWRDVAFTQSNPDICGYADGHCSRTGNCAKGCTRPRFSTRQKMRWDDEYLYIAAELEEPQVVKK